MSPERITLGLAESPLFQQKTDTLSYSERINLSYERASAVCAAYTFSREDVLSLTPKFWQIHTDPIWTLDGAALTLATIQFNLCAGTIIDCSRERKDLDDIIQQILSFGTCGQFCLTEVGHGLDAFHLETTATLLDNGDFDLHSPTKSAAKYMAPTTPVNGKPSTCVVFARLLVKGEDRGVRPFLVRIHDGSSMRPGVTASLLPPRGGSRPLNHALTMFNHVVLPHAALLGTLEKPENPRDSFFQYLKRVMVGTIVTAFLCVPALQVGSVLAARYSLRRQVVNNHTGALQPIISFQTQKAPVLIAVAQARVFEAFHPWAKEVFMTAKDPRVRHAIATVSKLVMVSLSQASLLSLGERCGAQGLFEVNQLSTMHAESRGIAIAEGDSVAIAIRLASELLLGRYAVPETADPTSLLARCETAMFKDLRKLMAAATTHRSEIYNQYILPESFPLIRAIGLRMAYDAAVAAGVDPALVSLFEASSVRANSAAFVELGVPVNEQRKMEVEAVEAVFPKLQATLDAMDVDAYITAPIVSEERWVAYIDTLRTWKPSEPTGTCAAEQGIAVEKPSATRGTESSMN